MACHGTCNIFAFTLSLPIAFPMAKTTHMPNFSLVAFSMAQKRDLWYSRLALATSSLLRVILTLPIAFPMAKTTHMPNFSLLGQKGSRRGTYGSPGQP